LGGGVGPGGGGVGLGVGSGAGGGVGDGNVVGVIVHKPSFPLFVAYTSQACWVGDDKRTAEAVVLSISGRANGVCRAGAGVWAISVPVRETQRHKLRKHRLIGEVFCI